MHFGTIRSRHFHSSGTTLLVMLQTKFHLFVTSEGAKSRLVDFRLMNENVLGTIVRVRGTVRNDKAIALDFAEPKDLALVDGSVVVGGSCCFGGG